MTARQVTVTTARGWTFPPRVAQGRHRLSRVLATPPVSSTRRTTHPLLYQSQGRYGDAEPLIRRSLAILEKALGPDHPSVATGVNNLALLYRAQGRYAEAEPLYKRSLGIAEKALGPEHPHVAQSLENYAALLRKTGRDAEAARMETRAKAMRTKHPEWTAQPKELFR